VLDQNRKLVDKGGYAPPTFGCRPKIFLIKLLAHNNDVFYGS